MSHSLQLSSHQYCTITPGCRTNKSRAVSQFSRWYVIVADSLSVLGLAMMIGGMIWGLLIKSLVVFFGGILLGSGLVWAAAAYKLRDRLSVGAFGALIILAPLVVMLQLLLIPLEQLWQWLTGGAKKDHHDRHS